MSHEHRYTFPTIPSATPSASLRTPGRALLGLSRRLSTIIGLGLGLVLGACDTEPSPSLPGAEAMADEGGLTMLLGPERDEEAAEASRVEASERELSAALDPQAAGSAVAALTQQIVPNSPSDPALIELVTLTNNPHILSAQASDVTAPVGLGVLSFAETLSARACAPGGTCKQRWILSLDISEVCELDGAYNVDFAVGCAPGSDCSLQDPAFTEFSVPFTLDSENFCGEIEVCPEYDLGYQKSDFCTEACPCEEGQGDCDSDNECAAGLRCVHNVGGSYGLRWSWDVCLPS